jgi:hypothetical protein
VASAGGSGTSSGCREELAEVLLGYESFEVVRDETDRTLDLFRSIGENELLPPPRGGGRVAPARNQAPVRPLVLRGRAGPHGHAVHFRVPAAMRAFYAASCACWTSAASSPTPPRPCRRACRPAQHARSRLRVDRDRRDAARHRRGAVHGTSATASASARRSTRARSS